MWHALSTQWNRLGGKREEETGLEVSREGDNNFDMLSVYLCRKLSERGWGKSRKTQTKKN